MSKIRSRRVTTVVLAPAAALATWALFRAAGVTFHVSTGSGRVGAGDVVVGATVAALLGWLVVRWLEGHVQRPRLWWARTGSTAFAISVIGPSWLADGVSSVALIVLHLVTAVVIVIGFAATVPYRRSRSAFSASVPDVSEPGARRAA
jgi:hypothetical protein